MDILFFLPIEATYISQLNPDSNFGPCKELFIGQSAMPNDTFRTLLKFDISSIPLESIIVKATLRLFINVEETSLPQTLYINRLLNSFSQNTISWNNTPEYEPTPYSTLISDINMNDYIYVNITDLVRGWYYKAIDNTGILLSTLESTSSFKRLFGFEDESVSLWPTLLIEYSKIKKQVENVKNIENTESAEVTNAMDISMEASNKDSSTISKNTSTGKKVCSKSNYIKKATNKNTNNKKTSAKGAIYKKTSNKVITGATSLTNRGSIIPFASGGPIIMTTTIDGQVGNTSLIGFGSAALDVTLLNDTINLTGSTLEPVLNFSFSIPRKGKIMSMVAYYSNIIDLNLIGTTITITAQLFRSTTIDNTFKPIPGAIVKLGPALTDKVILGSVCKGISTNLFIDINQEDRLLLAFSSTASGISLINTITGYASAGLNIV